MRPLLILGTRTFAPEVADVASDAGFEIAGFVENTDPARCDEKLEGLPVHWIDDAAGLVQSHHAVCALGTTHRRRFIEQAASLGFEFATVVHPSAHISKNSTVGTGSIIFPGVIVATRTTIGRHVILNRGTLVGHHDHVGDYCSFMPGSNVAGVCEIGEGTYIGMGAIVLDHMKVGAHAVVAAGSIVTKEVPSNVLVMGAPARVVRSGIDGR